MQKNNFTMAFWNNPPFCLFQCFRNTQWTDPLFKIKIFDADWLGRYIRIIYIWDILLLLSYESRDLSQADKKVTVLLSWANLQDDNYFQSKWSKLSFSVNIDVILRVAEIVTTGVFFSQLEINHMTHEPTSKN